MSFILDALKKAESERSRQLGPVLMDSRIAPPRRGLPLWGWLLGVILLVNLALLGWLLLGPSRGNPDTTIAPAASAPPTADAAPAAPPAPAADALSTPAPAAAPPVSAAPLPQATSTPVRASSPSLSTDVEGLPTAQELQAQGVVLPELQLNLHIYDAQPAHRSVLLNGQRLREGEFTPHGVRVERITEQSVVLEAAGRRFRIAAGG